MRVLSLSDIQSPLIYSPRLRERYKGVDFILGCGDLPYNYLEYVISILDVPLYFVRGNHDQSRERSDGDTKPGPPGGIDLHRRLVNHHGLLIAGIEGSLRYREGPFQYTQAEMWRHVYSLVPDLMRNRILYKRYLDIFVTHAPPRGAHDRDDLPHQGVDAFRWLTLKFKPRYHFHGHIHVYRPDEVVETRVGNTLVVNTYGYRETTF